MAIALDTLAYARRLREAGFSEQQAEGQAEALAAAMSDTLATKQDLQEMETRTAAGFASVRHEIRELESRMEVRFERIDSRFERIDSRFEKIEGQLEKIESRFERMESRQETTESHLGKIESRFVHLDSRIDGLEGRMDLRFQEQGARMQTGLADLERRMTVRLGGIMIAGIGALSALVTLA